MVGNIGDIFFATNSERRDFLDYIVVFKALFADIVQRDIETVLRKSQSD